MCFIFQGKKGEKRNRFFAVCKGRTFYKQTSVCSGRSGILWDFLCFCGAFFAVFSLCSCSQYQAGLLPMNLLQKYPDLGARWSTGMGSGEGQTSRITQGWDGAGTNTAWSPEMWEELGRIQVEMLLWMLSDVSCRPDWFLRTFPGPSHLALVGPAALGWMGCRWLIPKFRFSSWRGGTENSTPFFLGGCARRERGLCKSRMAKGRDWCWCLEWEGELHGKHGPCHPNRAWNHCGSSENSLKFPPIPSPWPWFRDGAGVFSSWDWGHFAVT